MVADPSTLYDSGPPFDALDDGEVAVRRRSRPVRMVAHFGPIKFGLIRGLRSTGLLGEAPGGVWRVFSRAGINVEHKKKVDLGGLRGPGHDGLVSKSPFSMIDGVCVTQVPSSR